MSKIKYSLLDRLLIAVDNGVRSLFAEPVAERANPAHQQPHEYLSDSERKQSAALMRINHTGEICAQALYYGQALFARGVSTENALLQAAKEETDHLAWCQERIHELHDHTSYLNPLWFLGAFSLGILAGMLHDKWSLGFVVETERQVEQHLQHHLTTLPIKDFKSREILTQMCEDEAHHGTVAMRAGAVELPFLIKRLMQMMSKVMTTTTYYI